MKEGAFGQPLYKSVVRSIHFAYTGREGGREEKIDRGTMREAKV